MNLGKTLPKKLTKELFYWVLFLLTYIPEIFFLFFKIFFLRWTFKKISIEFVTILFLFYVLVFWP